MAELETFRWDDMPREILKEGLGRRIISGDRVMLTHVYFTAGTEVPQHRHDNEQITWILEGALQFFFGEDGEDERIVRAGEVVVIPSDLPHSAVALEDTLDVDVFAPPREDFLAGGPPPYMRKD